MKIKPTRLILQCIMLLCFVMLFMTSYSQQQETTVKKAYALASAGPTTYGGVVSELGVQLVFKKNWVGTISYQFLDMNPKNVPGDYNSGVTFILPIVPIPVGNGYPNTEMQILNFTAGKFFEASRRIWFTTEAGLSYVKGDKYTFAKQAVVSDIWSTSANYSRTKEDVSTIGVVLKADFNWAFCPVLGLGAGVFANLNSIQSPVGFQLKLIGGWMHLKPKTKKS